MFLAIFLLFSWLVFLWFSADNLINSSVRIAKHYKVSALFIWLTVLAFWTSAPELFLSAMAAINGSWSLSVWNVIWSNIFNLWFILGLSAIVAPIVIQKRLVYRDWIFLLFITLLIFLMLLDQTVLLREWISLLSLLVWYNVFLRIKRDVPTDDSNKISIPKFKNYIYLFVWIATLSIIDVITSNWFFEIVFHSTYSWHIFLAILVLLFAIAFFKKEIPQIHKNSNWIFLSMIKLVASLWLLVLSSHHIVTSAVYIAEILWVSQRAIWATIIAAWTSLPEIAATVAAIMKKNYDMWVGNVIWSDIFNILWIIWISSVIRPLHLSSSCLFVSECNSWLASVFLKDNMFSLSILVLTLFITFIFMRTWRKLSKREWFILLIFAVLRMTFEINPNFFIHIFW